MNGLSSDRGPGKLPLSGKVPALLLLMLSGTGHLEGQVGGLPDDPLRGFEAYVQRTMAAWEIPGVAVGILKDDSVVYAKGFGVKELGKPGAVDTGTIFGNGSTTKAFTAALIGTLVDEGALTWDDPVVDHIPGFQLYDAYATQEVTVRDLLSHRTGVAARAYQLLQYWGSETTRPELVRRLRFEPKEASLRSAFIYHNTTYTAAGSVAEAVKGRSWEDLVRERIIDPLGMSSTTPLISDFLGQENVAMPHTRFGGEVFAVPWLDLSNIGPAGSMSSNVVDMLEWLRMFLNEGVHGGTQILSKESIEEMFSPQVAMPSSNVTGSHFAAYGLGWQLTDFRDRKVILHTGSAKGFRALMVLVPEENLGMIFFCNRHVSQYPIALMRTLLDRYLGTPDAPDRSAELLASIQAAEEATREQEAQLGRHRVSGTSPSLPLDQYTGPFADSLIGRVGVRLEGETLVWDVSPAFVGEMEHWHYDVFRVKNWRDPLWEDYPSMRPFVTFVIDPGGQVREMRVEGVSTFFRTGG